MSRRLPAACEASPAPALMAWDEGGALRWTLNDAGRHWGLARTWSEDTWVALAQRVVDEARAGRLDGSSAAWHLHWRALAEGDAWLAWLMPQETPAAELQALREQLARQSTGTQLALAVGLVGIGLWRRDFATRRMQFNDHANVLLGRATDAPDISDEELLAAIHADDRDAVARADEQALAGSDIVDAQVRCVRADGSTCTLMTRRVAERDEHGRAIALVGVALDITAEARQRSRIIEIAQSIELVADATGVGVWRADLDSGEPVWNRQMRRIFGVPDDARLADARVATLERTHPEDRERIAAAFDALVAGAPAPDELEFRVVRADGLRWVVARARFAQHGERRALFGVVIDVTEQRMTQERLRRAEQRTVLAAKAAGLGSWENDLVEQVTWWDHQMYRLRGLSPDDPRPAHELSLITVHPDDVPMVHRRFVHIVERENDFFFEFRVVRHDGAVRWLATRGSVTRDEHGRAQRLFGFNWDITEHKLAEDVRREKAAAEAASRAKSEFLSRMSHELRTPLNAVLGFAQLMLDDPAEPVRGGTRTRTEHIRDAGRHLLALIDDVLDLTSVEVGSVPLDTQSVALEPLVADALQWMSPAAAQAQVSLHAEPMRASVLADARRLRQVLVNLLSNAVKYNRVGGRVDVALMAGADDAVGLSVRDTGRGLTRAQMQRLFEPFNRLGAERENIEGTGIGLTIVRALVETMGGRVEVRSRPGEGTEFQVWLQRAAQAPDVQAPVAAQPPAHDADAPSEPIDVLYVEDNPVNVLLVQELVALRPHVRLHVAPDGRSGIARSRELRPHAVLIDLQLPDIDGFEVLRAVRADPVLAGVVCIALSANAMPDDVSRARRSGFDDYWTKPIDFGQFLGGLDVLSRRARAQEACANRI